MIDLIEKSERLADIADSLITVEDLINESLNAGDICDFERCLSEVSKTLQRNTKTLVSLQEKLFMAGYRQNKKALATLTSQQG